METVVIILMIMVCFGFVLKLTFHRSLPVIGIAAVCALFVGLMWPWAIEQSKTQIADWLANTKLMLDTSVVLCIEVIVQIAFCFTADAPRPKWLRLLRWFPGVLIFPVVFFFLVEAIFTFTGVSFSLIAWTMAAVVLVVVPSLTYVVEWLLPERELRLEMLFLANVMIAILGIIATVNGHTAVAAVGSIDWHSLACTTTLTFIGASAGLILCRLRKKTL